MAAANVHEQAYHARTAAGVLQILRQHILLRSLQSLVALLHQLQSCSSNLLGAVIVQQAFSNRHIIMICIELQHSLHLGDNLVALTLDNISSGRQLAALDFGFYSALDELQLTELTRSDEGHCNAGVPCTTGTANAVNIAFRILRNIKVDYVRNIVNVDTTSSNVRSNQHIHRALAEFLHNAVTLVLAQVAMQTFCHIATAGQSDRKIIYALLRAAEDDELAVDFCIKQTAQAFNLILSFKIILLNQRYSQLLLRNGYILRRSHVLLRQAENRTRHSCREEQRLALGRQAAHNLFDIVNKAHIQHFVCFVQYQEFDMVQTDRAAVDMVNQTTRGTDNNLHIVAQCADLTLDRLTAINRQRTHAAGAANFADFLSNLNSQLASRCHNQCLNMLEIGDGLYQRNTEGSSLAGTGLCLTNNVIALQHQRNGCSLNRRRLFKAHIRQGSYDFFVQL